MTIIAPSLLGADLLHLEDEVRKVESWGLPWLHFDHMDGHFVPNISFGPDFVSAVRKKTDLFLDVHLMLQKPLDYIEKYAVAGADSITVHAEAEKPAECLAMIHALGKKAGIALNPETPFDAVKPYIGSAELILIMTVHPGFGGQKLIPECLDKVRLALDATRNMQNRPYIETDGGINETNAQGVTEAGSNVLVMGTGLFRAKDPMQIIRSILEENA